MSVVIKKSLTFLWAECVVSIQQTLQVHFYDFLTFPSGALSMREDNFILMYSGLKVSAA